MSIVTNHSIKRIIERDDNVNFVAEAKKVAKNAFTAGKTIKDFVDCPKFAEYLKKKKNQARDCSVRVYRDNIYIWRGKRKNLVTAHPIPDRFKDELKEKLERL